VETQVGTSQQLLLHSHNRTPLTLTSLDCRPEYPPQEAAKVLCIIHYFERVKEEGFATLCGQVSFNRQALPPSSYPKWSMSRAELTKVR
jgi:hypothetical protein